MNNMTPASTELMRKLVIIGAQHASIMTHDEATIAFIGAAIAIGLDKMTNAELSDYLRRLADDIDNTAAKRTLS